MSKWSRQGCPVELAIMFIWCIGLTTADILVFSNQNTHEVERGFRDLPARFGGLIPAEGIKGYVVYAEPPNACRDIQGPPNSSEYSGSNWIVLIARLNCSFEEKIRYAQKAGYNAAIVHNVGSNELEQMSAKDPTNITIPSVFVSEFTGSLLRDAYSYEDYFVLINDLPININTHLLLPFAIVVGICFLIMVTFMVIRCVQDRRRARRHRLPNSSLKKIPIHKYTKGDPYETCAICLDDYIENEKLRVLPCAHAYHTKCIDQWLTKNRRVCPICKRKVFAADERVESDTDSDSDVDDSTPLIRDGRRPGTQGGTFDAFSDPNFLRELHRHRQMVVQSVEQDLSQQQQQQQPPRRAARRTSHSSDSSYYSTSTDHTGSDEVAAGGTEPDAPVVLEEQPGSSTQGGRRRGILRRLFMSSESQSVNGEVPDLEKSASSTRPHTVNLSVDAEENSTVEVIRHNVSRHMRDDNDVII